LKTLTEKHEYSKEELIAKLGTSMPCTHVNLNAHVKEDSGNYIRSCLEMLNRDKIMIIHSIFRSQMAV